MSENATIYATGRRKTSIAKVRLTEGTGSIKINGRTFEDYFPSLSLQNQILQPFQVAEKINQFNADIQTQGGGIIGQVGAIRLGISRALVKLDSELRTQLKKEGLLRRDPRMKERKKAGQPGARKRFQFSKR